MANIHEIFGSNVFNEPVMKARLPRDTYKALKSTIAKGKALDPEIANIVANAMKEWALEKGATHFTHWFQPLTGVTAEKHDSFVAPDSEGRVIMEFSGKALVQGEPDASSFPSGGLRAVFEARGYTAWDPTSYAFIKDGTLCIPTAFCSYSGEALDQKTPLLRSMEAIEKQAMRLLSLFPGNTAKRVITTVGAEQEYFLIDKAVYEKRPDLMYCGRSLFGARPPKGQELDDHYFGAIKPRVAAFMRELDEELWKLGVLAKTEHNEVAPAQHELAPIYTTTNISADHNQLTMECMKRIADRHGLVCLLHEKPFAGVNGSGKHNNWALSTDEGRNLLDPGKNPSQNLHFLLFLTAVIKAVDLHQDLLRISVATAGNDHRLGANEAPPAIVSMFLGDELTEILESIRTGEAYTERKGDTLKIGAKVLPNFMRDTTDRNRTSPMAFTGNKFEFRMVGSAASISSPNVVLNTAVADVLAEFAAELKDVPEAEFERAVRKLIAKTIDVHGRIIFNGNNYSEEWVEEAERRGLLNLKSTVDALPYLVSEKNVALFERHGVLRASELVARHEIYLENYCKTVHIEALTMIDMVKRKILPTAIAYQGKLADVIVKKNACGLALSVSVEETQLKKLVSLTDAMYAKLAELEVTAANTNCGCDIEATARTTRDGICREMAELREIVDAIEMLVAGEDWPYPTYAEILYSVR